jgi:hypothetical protein
MNESLEDLFFVFDLVRKFYVLFASQENINAEIHHSHLHVQAKKSPGAAFETFHVIKSKLSHLPITRLATCFKAYILLCLSDPEDGGDMFLRNVS